MLIKPEYFHRNYDNDFPHEEKESSTVIRATKAALPFISLYKPIGRTLAGALGTTRALSSLQECFSAENRKILPLFFFRFLFAVSAVTGTLFLHPLGMAMTTVQDMGGNLAQIYGAVNEGDFFETSKQIAHLGNHTLYLGTMLYGSLQWQVASLGIQVLVAGGSSIEEFMSGNWLEGSSHLLMAAVRTNQWNDKVLALKQKWEIEEAIRSVYVGKLGEKWQFPSDHLPVGIEINGVKVISWNVLNGAYMDWVTENDSQGLNGSMLTELHVQVNDDGLTLRDQKVVEMLLSMADEKTGVITLQECGMSFVQELEGRLPENWQMVKSMEGFAKNQEIILYNTSKLTCFDSETVYGAFASAPTRALQGALFDFMGTPLRIFNLHIPGDPNLPAREDFACYLKERISDGEVVLALGDNNFTRTEMEEAYKKAGFFDFILFSPWQTNIDPYSKESKCIDHIFLAGEAKARRLRADEILAAEYRLEEMIALLRGSMVL